MIKVCHITTIHNLNDGRIFFKECVSLENHSYQVNLIAPGEKKQKILGIQVIPVKNYSNRLIRVLAGSCSALRKALRSKAVICHFHDPELMLMGVMLKCAGRKVIYDVHEDLPKQVLYKDWIKSRFIRWLLSFIIHIVEKFFCLFYDGIFTATEDIARRFPGNKTIVLRNFPVIKMINKTKCADFNRKTNLLIYAGGLFRIRGIKEIVMALEQLSGKAELILLGEFEDPEYFEECKTLNGWKYVHYLGIKRMDEVYNYIKIADIGIATLYPVKNYLTSLPVKVFEYMAFGKPVLMSDFLYWKKIFRDCAVFTDPQNPREIAEKIEYMLNNPGLIKKLGNNGLKLVQDDFCWEKEQTRMIDFYKNI